MEKPEGAFSLLKKENKNILKSFFFALFSVEKPKIHSEESDRQEKKKNQMFLNCIHSSEQGGFSSALFHAEPSKKVIKNTQNHHRHNK